MEQSFQNFTINADTNGNLVKEKPKKTIFFLSIKEVKSQFLEDYNKQVLEYSKKSKI